MKKNVLLILLLALGLLSSNAFAMENEGHINHGGFHRVLDVMGRGLLNLVSFPLEIPRTFAAEPEIHHRLWPLTAIPRSVLNTVVRAVSGVNDLVLFPWIVPFTDDISPWTEPFDLPDYAWQKP